MTVRTFSSCLWSARRMVSSIVPIRILRMAVTGIGASLRHRYSSEDERAPGGYAMAALLVAMSVMAVMLSVAVPVWQTAIRREREAELVFRGEQYMQAIALFQRRYAGTFPPSVDVLVQQRFLRRRYQDPMTNGDFQVLYAGTGTVTAGTREGGPGRGAPGPMTTPPGRGTQATAPLGRGGIIGVVSTSTAASLRQYNGRGRYSEWTFVATQATTQAGAPSGGRATQTPGRGGSRGIGPPARGAPAAPGRSGQPPLLQPAGRGAPR